MNRRAFKMKIKPGFEAEYKTIRFISFHLKKTLSPQRRKDAENFKRYL